MPFETATLPRDPMNMDAIPVWSRTIGSWRFSIGRRPFKVDELAHHYDKASASWQSTINRLGFEAAYTGLVDRALPKIADASRSTPLRVLDAGIGSGALAAVFAGRCQTPVDLTGVDVSSEMLRQANRHLSKRQISARLILGDVNNLPFADDTFDVILVAHVLEHMTRPEITLSELFRVLKPGGMLVACVTQLSSAGAYIHLKWRTHCVDTKTAVGWFQDCGFASVQTVPLQESPTARRFSCGYVVTKPGLRQALSQLQD